MSAFYCSFCLLLFERIVLWIAALRRKKDTMANVMVTAQIVLLTTDTDMAAGITGTGISVDANLAGTRVMAVCRTDGVR